MSILLYQFPISHYCEKARWALDYKGITYQIKNLLPGLHVKPLRRMVADTTVPVLYINDQAIQGSDRIIDFLDSHIDMHKLTPEEHAAHEQAREWEQFVAERIADPLRACFYHYLLEHPAAVIQMFTAGGPWYGKLFYRFAWRQVEQRIRAGYHINQRSALLAMRVINKALDRLEQHLAQHRFLVGDQFTRADLSVCALLSPLVMPERGYIRQDSFLPEALQEYRAQHLARPVFRWVNDIYNTYR